MKIAKLMTVALAAGLLTLAGCNKDNKGSAGDMGTKSECCKDKASMGATGAKSDCCAEGKKANMGATSTKTDCSSTCTDKKANMGAVQGKTDCSTKSSCTADKANMGAVSAPAKTGCCSEKKTN